MNVSTTHKTFNHLTVGELMEAGRHGEILAEIDRWDRLEQEHETPPTAQASRAASCSVADPCPACGETPTA